MKTATFSLARILFRPPVEDANVQLVAIVGTYAAGGVLLYLVAKLAVYVFGFPSGGDW